MVMPEREMPGVMAALWASPMIKASWRGRRKGGVRGVWPSRQEENAAGDQKGHADGWRRRNRA